MILFHLNSHNSKNYSRGRTIWSTISLSKSVVKSTTTHYSFSTAYSFRICTYCETKKRLNVNCSKSKSW